MKNYDFELNYKSGGRNLTLRENCDGDVGDLVENGEITLVNKVEEFGNGKTVKVYITPKKHVILKKFNLRMAFIYPKNSRIYCNGYQSWTDSREYFPDETMKGLSLFARTFSKALCVEPYGDYTFVNYYPKKTGYFHSFSYTYIVNEGQYTLFGSMSERSGYTVFKHRTTDGRMAITKDVDGVVLDAGKEYELLNIVLLRGGYDEVFDEYFSRLGIAAPREKRRTGYTTWYNHYQDINQNVVDDNLKAFREKGIKLDIFQIDDGYQQAIGDWLSTDRNKFPDGMKRCADSVKEEGMIPGLWLAPFACTKNSDLFKNHIDWLVKDAKGNPMKAGSNWGGFYTLDIYNPDAAEYLRHVFDVVLNQWGYEMVKLDFLYQAAIVPRLGKSRGQLMCEAMDFLRDCVGDKLILGCGVPLMPAFGKVDFCRIGCDVALNWDGAPTDRLLHRERVSTKYAITNSVYRRHLDGRAFVNDPDVFLLRDENISLNKDQKYMLAKINNMFGNLLFTSDNVRTYDEQKKEIYDRTLAPFDGEVLSVEIKRPYTVCIEYVEAGIKKRFSMELLEGKITEDICL